MYQKPLIIAIILYVSAIVSIALLLLVLRPLMTVAETTQAIIMIIATAGALISAVFVVSAYLQSIRTFTEAYRPQLLVQIINRHEENKQSPSPTPITHFNYHNISNYQFNELTFYLSIDAFGKEINLCDLFSPKMTMAGHDQRTKWFKPVLLASERGIHLNTEVEGQSPPVLHIEYEYTYIGRKWRHKCQDYYWKVIDQIWVIA